MTRYELTGTAKGGVELEYLPSVNYAMARAGLKTCVSCVVENCDETDWQDITLQVSGEMIDFSEIHLETITAGSRVQIEQLRIEAKKDVLLSSTEATDTVFTLKLSIGGEEQMRQELPIRMLAYEEWAGIGIMPELLAAFVTPNHPLLSRVITEAAKYLERWTGSSSMDAYQTQDRNRVRMQVASIYEALRGEGIVYSEPMASFEQRGQRIRLVDRVLTEKLGTCLDTTVLMASCFEAIGLFPIVVIMEGHAFVGAWLNEQFYSQDVGDDASYLLKQSADGVNNLVLVESTCITSSSPMTFDDAVAAAEKKLRMDQQFRCFIDIRRCRLDNVRPLPVRVLGESGWVLENEGVEHDTATEGIQTFDHYALHLDHAPQQITKQLIWERKLLDFSLRNNLINCRLGRRVIPFVSFGIDKLEDEVFDGNDFSVIPYPKKQIEPTETGMYDSRLQAADLEEMARTEAQDNCRLISYHSQAELDSALKFVYRASRNSLEENGANTLFLVLGMLKWYENEKSVVPRFAPILLMPVNILRKAGNNYIIRTREEDIIINITLVELLRQQFKVNLNIFNPLPKDEHGVDVKMILSAVRQSISEMSRWDVMEESLLGLFSFNKFVMWNDIHNNAEHLKENEVVRSLMEGKVQLSGLDETVDARNADRVVQPSEFAIPVDVDSSQLEAVIESGNGKSFILYGPPGTGKSQTITNMIANALYHDKRVLFVAEKMAALEVVQRRLAKIGLDPFCLELHSNKVSKTHFLQQMQKALDVTRIKSPEDFEQASQQLFADRQQLIKYMENLHRKHSNGYSLYDTISEYLSIDGDEIGEGLPEGSNVTRAAMEQWAEQTVALDTVFDITGHPADHPLLDIAMKQYTFDNAERLKQLLQQYRKAYADLIAAYNVLPVKGLETDAWLEWTDRLGKTVAAMPVINETLLQYNSDETTNQRLLAAAESGRKRDAARSELLRTCSPSLLQADMKQWQARWQQVNDKWFLPKYFAKKNFMKEFSTYCPTAVFESIPATLKKVEDYQQLNAVTTSSSPMMQAMFGVLAQPDNEQWDTIEPSLRYAPYLSKLLLSIEGGALNGNSPAQNNYRSKLNAQHSSLYNDFSRRYEALKGIMAQIEQLVSIGYATKERLTAVPRLSERWLANMDKLKDWSQYTDRTAALYAQGLHCIPRYIVQKRVSARDASLAFRKGMLHRLTMQMVDKDEQLRMFNGLLFEKIIEKYRQETYAFQELTKKELYCRLAARIPSQTVAAAANSEMGILKRNIANGGRGTSIRKIIDQIPTLLPKLCPVMLMSPISVAQYIDMEGEKFDLVVFDEASQMPTSEAVGAIARGKALICVGDPKQMPPTSFFATQQVDEDEADIDDMDSILDDCITLSMPGHYLSWHYRSKHESLIAFSNQQYYDGRLFTFPSVDDRERKVSLVQIEGTYDKGRTRSNRAEAEAIVAEVLRRLADPEMSKRSIGIVSFSKVQQNLIEDILIEELAKQPELEAKAFQSEEPLFIKNLENVQGDERDVILFSVGYGPDKSGNVSMNFGPLNNDGGERRLNVAVSRSRYEMIVYSTMRADQIDLKRSSAKGVEGLKRFLEFAANGTMNIPQSAISTAEESKLVNLVAKELEEHGYQVQTNVGRSNFKIDIAVVDPDDEQNYMLGILCDGKNYYETKTTRDREIVQPNVLNSLKWEVMRVWSVDWYENKEKVVSRILERIEGIRNKTLPPDVPVEETKPKAFNVEDEEKIDVAGTESAAYRHASFGNVPPKFSFDSATQNRIKEIVRQLVTEEQPVTHSYVKRRMADLMHMENPWRLDSLINDVLETCSCKWYPDLKQTTIFATEEDRTNYEGHRSLEGREIEEIPIEELANAMHYLVEQQVSVPTKELKRLTAHLVGKALRGKDLMNCLDTAIEMLKASGKIVERNETLSLA